MSVDWWDRAACRGTDTETFFCHQGRNQALRICRTCPVRAECLEAALTEERHASSDTGPFGMRGGIPAVERRAMIRARKVITL